MARSQEGVPVNSQPDNTFPGWLSRIIRENSLRMSGLHALFLRQRGQALLEMTELIKHQSASLGVNQPASEFPNLSGQPVLFDTHQLDAFGAGNLTGCFGAAFMKYDGRQIPRIPNGDLRMMSRVIAIQGEARNFNLPASVDVEYDIPQDAWYLCEGVSEAIPYSLLMEIALQPCGFLSAYLDTYALVPYETFYFRNLDGHAQIVDHPRPGFDLRGKTVATRASLVTSVASGGTVIQKFRFSVRVKESEQNGGFHFQGESTFGYFSAQTMANQVGLDSGKQVATWLQEQPAAKVETVNLDVFRGKKPGFQGLTLPSGRLGFLDQVQFVRNGGRFGDGYLYARCPVNPADWFYPFHFSGDPVMPGSLGVECVLEALKASALAAGSGAGQSNHFSKFALISGSQPTTWRYRGQVTPAHRVMELEVHLKPTIHNMNEIILTGDANILVDGTRIYEIKNAGIRII